MYSNIVMEDEMGVMFGLPRAGTILKASLVFYEQHDGLDAGIASFVRDHDTEDYWSICTGYREPIMPVQRHTTDGWVAAIFHRGYGYIKIVAPGEYLNLPRGQSVVARVCRQGVRWEFADPPD
jgi:hypothetical protein